MKLLSTKTILPAVILAVLVLTPEVTHAQDFLQGVLWTAVVGIFGTILQISAAILDFAINRFVIGFAFEYTTSVGVAIDAGWALVRDVMNLFFIFGLLYIGIKILLGSDDSRTKSMVANLIIAALLVNFSLFITKFVVDISNSLASEIAVNGFVEDADAQPIQVANGGQPITLYQVDMSADLMNRLGINGIWDAEARSNSERNGWGYIFGVAILLIVASFTFAAAGIILIIRFVVLLFYMLFSPFMFIGWAFPPLARYTSLYWQGFLGRAFFAPVYFLLLYFALQIVGILGQARNVNQFQNTSLGNDLLGGDIDPNSSLPFFFVAVITLVASMMAAQKLGAEGGATAVSVGKQGLKKVQNTVKRSTGSVTFGAAGSLGRNTVGRAANAYYNSDSAKNRAANGSIGRFALKTSNKIAGSSFDARRVGGLGKSMGIGEGQKGGYAKIAKDNEKDRKALEKHLGTTDTKTPENQVRVKQKAEEIRSAKRTEEAVKQDELARAAAIAVAAKSGTDGVAKQIAMTEKNIESINKLITGYDEKLADPTLSSEDRNEIEKKKAEREGRLELEERNLEALNAAEQNASERSQLKLEDEQLAEEEKAATGAELASIKERRREIDSKIAEIDAEFDKNVDVLTAELSNIQKDIKEADKEAEATIKYEKQIKLMESFEKSQKFAKWKAAGAGGITALGVGAATTGPVGLGLALAYGAVAAASTSAHYGNKKSDAAALKREYGKNLRQKMKNDSNNKKFSEAMKAAGIKNNNEGSSDAKKDSDDKDNSE